MKKQLHVQNIRRILTDFLGTMDLACKGLESKPKWESDMTQQTNFMLSPDMLLQNFDTKEIVIAPLIDTHSSSCPMFFLV